MTVEKFLLLLNNTYGLRKWPDSYEVDADTYANVCQFVFDKPYSRINGTSWARIAIGPNNGIMIRNIELILKK